MTSTGDQILKRQNDEKGLRLLAARQETFEDARKVFLFQFFIMVIMPFGAWIYVTLAGEGRIIVATGVIFLTLLDILFVDTFFKSRTRSAAKIAEEFDNYVFQLGSDILFSGNPEEVEVIRRRAASYKKKHGTKKIENWYSVKIADLPLKFATFVCQRINLTYDKQLRRIYRNIIFISLSSIIAIMLAGTLSVNQTLTFLVTALLLPAAPVIIWSFREWRRQKEAIDEAERIATYVEGILNGVLIGQINEDLARDEARRIQNAIYLRRAANPLPFPGIYHLKRANLEQDMHNGATHWAERFKDEMKH